MKKTICDKCGQKSNTGLSEEFHLAKEVEQKTEYSGQFQTTTTTYVNFNKITIFICSDCYEEEKKYNIKAFRIINYIFSGLVFGAFISLIIYDSFWADIFNFSDFVNLALFLGFFWLILIIYATSRLKKLKSYSMEDIASRTIRILPRKFAKKKGKKLGYEFDTIFDYFQYSNLQRH